MKIKIISCKHNSYWYSDTVGSIYDVLETVSLDDGLNYKTDIGYILSSDAQVLNDDAIFVRLKKSAPNYIFRTMTRKFFEVELNCGKPNIVYSLQYEKDCFLEKGTQRHLPVDDYEIVNIKENKMKVVEKKNNEQKYPCLKVGTKGMIVLFTTPSTGTIVNNNSQYEIGHHSDVWDKDCFTTYNGTLEISNGD